MTARSYGLFPPDDFVGGKILIKQTGPEVGLGRLGPSSGFIAVSSF
jgi:hypothetical protein